jgi:hypothetical protein
MVSAPVNCVDDRVGFTGEFIMQTFVTRREDLLPP